MTNHGILEIAGSNYGVKDEFEKSSPWNEFMKNINEIGSALDSSMNQMIIGNDNLMISDTD